MRLSAKSLAHPIWRVYALTLIGALCVYAVALASRHDADLGVWLGIIASSAVPLFVCCIAARYFIVCCVHPRRPMAQAFLHLCAGTVFSIILFFVLMAALSLRNGEATPLIAATHFRGPAAMWQFAQCASLYGFIALIAQLEKRGQFTEDAQAPSMVDRAKEGGSTEAERENDGLIFVRNGNEIVPLRTERIIRISGARDYAEVVTPTGTHLLRMSLVELERKLGSGFLRVHRSTIVNIDQIDRVEPAGGGRLRLHLLNGDIVSASRAGAKRIKELTL